MKKLQMMLLVLSAFLVFTACGSKADVKKSEVQETTATTAEKPAEAEKKEEKKAPESYKVGDAVDFNNLTVTLNGVRESKGKLIKPKDGKKFVVVDVTVENKGDADKTISSLIQTAMSDGDGYSYSIALSDDEKASLNGNVAAGKKLRGEVTFELPKEAKELEFTFKGALEKGSITWKL
ncbi:DUF4352 domain-containing protein [Paenibacillus terrigena]|uniref:DUF4352 domain-containing protein n=1 Tax=Paenibacillus terrigena TaxID=369333 RepID=UPI0028D394CF|nr:DUF4352 domain-containing protein [Paenibacillus terrigena]